MNTREVKILVEKYFGGETTLQEEKELMKFFASGNVPEELQYLTPVFAFFSNEKRVVPSEKLNEEINKISSTATVIQFFRKRAFWLTVSGIAASIVFIVAVVIESGKNQPSEPEKSAKAGYSKEETRHAYNQTRQVLAYVSDKFNRGVEPLNQVSKIGYSSIPVSEIRKFDKGLNDFAKNVEKMDKGVGQLDKLSKINIIIKL